MRFARSLLAIALLAASTAAWGQSTLLQGTAVTPGHVPAYVSSGSGQAVVGDSGPASGGGQGLGISELLQVNRSTTGTGPLGAHNCFYDNPTTSSAGYHYLCLDANAQGGGLLAYGAGGAGATLPLAFNVNGTAYQFPFSIGGVVGPSVSAVNDAACWNNTVGTLLKDCGPFVTVAGNNTWTGTNNFTGTFQIGGVTQTFPASGNILGASDVQSITNKNIGASQINSGTLPAVVMPAFTGDVTSAAGSVATTIAAGAVTNAKLATAAQNTVKGAATSTAVTDLAMPSCSGASNAIQWLTNTGFQCGTLGATTAGWGLTLSGGGAFSVSTTAPPYGFDMPVNLGLSASVGASALTITLTTAAGATPSATNPVLVPFRSTTLATGTVVWSAITGATSITIPSAATLGTANSVPFRVWVFMAYSSGVPQLMVATCSNAAAFAIFPCSGWETSRVTTTTISGFATAPGTAYATTGVANDAVRIIGYVEYSSGLGTVGSWSATPTVIQIAGPGTKRPGDMIQALRSTTTATTACAGTLTATVVTQGISPSSSPNAIRYAVNGTLTNNTSTGISALQVFRNVTGVGHVALMFSPGVNNGEPVSLSDYDFPGTASSTTYTAYCNFTTGTAASFPTNNGGNIVIEEIMGLLEPANDNQELRMVG